MKQSSHGPAVGSTSSPVGIPAASLPTSDGAELVKLLDFGVAKLLNRDDEDIGFQTAAGSVIGTPAYMSPEQAGGMAVDARSDIYSLGVMLFELLVGRKPFEADSFGEIVVKHLTEAAPHPNALAKTPLPEAIDAIIWKCLQKVPADRPQSMLQLREALSLDAKAVAARPSRRGRWMGLAAVACIGAIATLVVVDPLHWRRALLVAPAPAPAPAPPPVAEEPKTVEVPNLVKTAGAPKLVDAPAVVAPDPAATEAAKATELKKKTRRSRIDRGGLVNPYGSQ